MTIGFTNIHKAYILVLKKFTFIVVLKQKCYHTKSLYVVLQFGRRVIFWNVALSWNTMNH